MEERENISAEIKLLAPALEGISKKMPYALPEGYFETLPFELLGKLAMPIHKPAVPEGYFDALPSLLLAKVKGQEVQQELESVAPLLNTISKQMPYEVPSGYFENLELPDRKEAAPVISIHSKRKPWLWAAAACVLAVVGMIAWQYIFYSPVSNSGTTIAGKVTTDSLNAELATALQQVEDTSINSELTDPNVTEDISSALYYLNTENFETALQDFSDEEIKAQLAIQDIPSKKS